MNPWNLLLSILGSTLAFFYDIVPEYGIAIILLTLLVGLLLFPLTSTFSNSRAPHAGNIRRFHKVCQRFFVATSCHQNINFGSRLFGNRHGTVCRGFNLC